MKWKQPPIIKVYEALGALADERVHVDGTTAKVYSSSGNKYYDVVYNPEQNAITANDNGSYWVGYLGYPSIALLCAIGVTKYHHDIAALLKGIAWKDVNVAYKNDFKRTEQHVRELVAKHANYDEAKFDSELNSVLERTMALDLSKLQTNAKPPTAY